MDILELRLQTAESCPVGARNQLGLLQGQPVPLTAEPFPQILSCYSLINKTLSCSSFEFQPLKNLILLFFEFIASYGSLLI